MRCVERHGLPTTLPTRVNNEATEASTSATNFACGSPKISSCILTPRGHLNCHFGPMLVLFSLADVGSQTSKKLAQFHNLLWCFKIDTIL